MYALLNEACPKVMRILENSKLNNRLSHAYLFTGPKGSFKIEAAKYFAMMLYCKETHPCGVCPDCQAILENRHINVTYIEPLGQSIKKEQILALQEEFSKTSLVEGPRIYIIDEADTMSASAANSLLKFIEEPTSEETYGILITEHKDNMLSTIISRSIVINFDGAKKTFLKEQYKELAVEGLAKDILVEITNNIDDARGKLESRDYLELTEVFQKYLMMLTNNNIGLFFRANAEFFYDKEFKNNTANFLNLLEKLYRDIYEYKISKKVLVFDSQVELISKLQERYSGEVLLYDINQILELERKIGYNVNVSLNLNQLLIDLRGGKI